MPDETFSMALLHPAKSSSLSDFLQQQPEIQTPEHRICCAALFLAFGFNNYYDYRCQALKKRMRYFTM